MSERAVCPVCGVRPCERHPRGSWRPYCWKCRKQLAVPRPAQAVLPGTVLCASCGVRPREANGRRGRHYRLCWKCRRPERNQSAEGRRRLRWLAANSHCSRCGFVPEHPCQMEIHHKDGDPRNNEPENIAVLCANCHCLPHRLGWKVLLPLEG